MGFNNSYYKQQSKQAIINGKCKSNRKENKKILKNEERKQRTVYSTAKPQARDDVGDYSNFSENFKNM